MKKVILLLIFLQLSLAGNSQVIANHTVVDLYDDIPQQWIDSVKTMWVSMAGESHAYSFLIGLGLLEALDERFQVSVTESGTPLAYTTSELRFSAATWGDHDHANGWQYWYGEEDFWTNPTAITRTKASLQYCNDNGYTLAAFGFTWCWDATWTNAVGGPYDPVYYTRFAGSTAGGPDGNLRWGLDDDDAVLTDNSVSMRDYIQAVHVYIDYCRDNDIDTKMIWTTGPVDNNTNMALGESGYQQYLKYTYLRNHIDSLDTGYFFDFADILSYNDAGELSTTAWTDNNGVLQTFPIIHSENFINSDDDYHFGPNGAIKIAKALWWLLARIAGWDGTISSTWLGVTTDWNTASNWSIGRVPGSETNVLIPGVANSPHITIPNAECNNLIIEASASLVIDAGQALTTRGDLTNTGTLTIESSATTMSGSLIVTGTSSGNVTYNRMMPASLYHYISSPVSSALLPTSSTYWLWDEPLGIWVETTSCTSGTGYTILTDANKVPFTGSLVNSVTQIGTAPYTTPYSLDRATWGGGGWNLLGNPFTSSLDGSLFISTNTLSMDENYQAMYIYDGNDYYYIAAETPGYPDLGTFSGTDVQAGQGFFVLAHHNGVNFNFTSSMRKHNTSAVMTKSASTEEAWPGLLLKVNYGDKESSILIVYNENMTAGLDPGYDIGMLSAGHDVEIYSTLAGKDNEVNFARQALPVAFADTIIVPIGIDTETGGEVTFSAFTVPLGNNGFWLEDREAGILTDISTGTYTVTLPAMTYGTGRFYLKSANTATAVETPGEESGLRIWASQDRVIIKGATGAKAMVAVYDLKGNKILETLLPDEALNTVAMPSGAHGVFLVRVVDGGKIYTKKVVFL